MRPAINIEGLAKTYAASGKSEPKHALKAIDLEVPVGSMFALLGPNGAGKSTLINILGGLVNKSAGKVDVWGFDMDVNPRNCRAKLGIVPQELALDPFFSPREAVEIQAGLYGVPKSKRRTMEILEAVGLDDKADAYARSLSGGMRRRLLVAKALVHNPPILILDEPTAGVDINLRQTLWAYVRKLNEDGTTIILTTHYLEEAQELCDRVAIINHGEIVANETKDKLLGRFTKRQMKVTLDDGWNGDLPRHDKITFELLSPVMLQASFDANQLRPADVISCMTDAGLPIRDLEVGGADLEDVFISLTS